MKSNLTAKGGVLMLSISASSLLAVVCLIISMFPGLPAGTAEAAPRTVVLQQGKTGYTGAQDTWVSSLNWDTPPQYTVNYGRHRELMLSRDGGDNPLLRFDLSSIPVNSEITAATLSLYNTTASSFSGSRSFSRRIQLFRVLRDWDEGNQVASTIDAPGKHGATGQYAFAYHGEEGTSIPWGAVGMAADIDYESTSAAYADVGDEGWYSWKVKDLVRLLVRGEQPNFGMVLRDATGYEDDHRDWRSFRSSQSPVGPNRRPKLTVTYNPDVPLADAGPDQEYLSWNGSPVTLDGSASRDRPGGLDAALTYGWRIVACAYGSDLRGEIYSGPSPTASFQPDVPGEWELELTVTNSLGEHATDRVKLRLLRIRADHPRIYLTPEKLARLKARAKSSNFRWTQLRDEALTPDAEIHAKALVSLVSDQPSRCREAIAGALQLMKDPGNWSTKGGDLALVYDWCHAQLSADDRTTFLDYLNQWAEDALADPGDGIPGWGNYWPRYGYSFALIGLATYGDHPGAGKWLDDYRHRRFRDHDLPLLKRIAEGGGWPEGMIYDWIANWPRVKALEAWRTATGEDLFRSTAWFRNRLPYILLHRWPGLDEQWGYRFHPYLSTGDTERHRGSMANYERIMALILIERFPGNAIARQLQAYLAAPPTGNSMSFLYHEEFLWFNPDQPTSTPRLLSHHARDLGSIFLRSDWPDGKADTKSSATYITFQAGNHFSYHQHYDQNSFTLFKHGDLTLDSGVYSGDGRSNHDVNYYVRTIAHNTLVVYNPVEDFSAARPDASSNDGGQRTMAPATRSPQTIDYYDQHAAQYHTGEVLRYEDAPRYTYALGDAARAYNNPAYNQAMDGGLSGNVAKVSRFQREFVYLRPETPGGADFVVIYDRVGVTQPAFSGGNTKLLFHTLRQPVVNGAGKDVSPGERLFTDPDLVTADADGGRLFLKALLPEHRNIRRVGGRGVKAFWVFDHNYDWQWEAGEPQPRPVSDFEDVPYGEWRIEIEPADTALEHNFLTVLHPTGTETEVMPATVLIAGSGVQGAHLADPSLNRVALFSSASDGSPSTGTISYSFTPTAPVFNLLVDLAPNAGYSLATADQDGVLTVTLTPDPAGPLRASGEGVLSFAVTP
jgi:hypothetical protein